MDTRYYLTPLHMLRDFPEIGICHAVAFWARLWNNHHVVIWQHHGAVPNQRATYPDWVWASIPLGVHPDDRFRSRRQIRECFPWVSWESSRWYWRHSYTFGRVLENDRLNDVLYHFERACSGRPVAPGTRAPRIPIYHPTVDRLSWIGRILWWTGTIMVGGIVGIVWLLVELFGAILSAAAVVGPALIWTAIIVASLRALKRK